MLSSCLKRSPMIIILFAMLTSSVLADMTIDGFTDATNDRFTNAGSFIGGTNNFSGVARSGGWVTMVSSNVGLSANHSHPANSAVVDFYLGNDPNVAPIQRTISSGQRIGSTDLYAIIFDTPVPASIKFYDFATEDLTGTPSTPTSIPIENAGSFQDEIAFMFGVSETVRALGSIDQAIGENQIDGYAEDFPLNGSNNDTLVLKYDQPGLTHESLVNAGDSGAPVFVVRGGELLLIGINSAKFSDSNGGQFNAPAYIGNFDQEINAIITANAVPEPGSILFLSICSLAVAARRRR